MPSSSSGLVTRTDQPEPPGFDPAGASPRVVGSLLGTVATGVLAKALANTVKAVEGPR